MSKYDTIVINLFGGPGIGKTTTANRLVGELKITDIDAIYIAEYVKELIYKVKSERISDTDKTVAAKLLDGSLYSQACVFSRQKEMLDIYVDQVPVIVTDSPLPLNLIYLKDLSDAYNKDVLRCFNDEYINLNIVLERDPEATFQVEGRIHSESESLFKDKEIVEFLRAHDISYVRFPVNSIEDMLQYIKAAIDQCKGIAIASSEIFDDSMLAPDSVYIENVTDEKCIVLTTIGDDVENHRFSIRHIPYEEVKKGFYRTNANYDEFFDYLMDQFDTEYVVRGTDAWNNEVSRIEDGIREGQII